MQSFTAGSRDTVSSDLNKLRLNRFGVLSGAKNASFS
jgi:hypothetical protein